MSDPIADAYRIAANYLEGIDTPSAVAAAELQREADVLDRDRHREQRIGRAIADLTDTYDNNYQAIFHHVTALLAAEAHKLKHPPTPEELTARDDNE